MGLPLKRRHEKVLILGTASTTELAPVQDESFDVWAVAAFGRKHPQLAGFVDVLFEMHSEKVWKVPRVYEQLQGFGGPVVMLDKQPSVPGSVRYPYEEVHAEYYREAMGDWLYATNSVVYMLMLAGLMGYEEVHMYGVHMAHQSEYGHQKPNCTYFLGWLAAKGCTVVVPGPARLLSAPYLYGYEDKAEEIAALRNDQARYEKEKAEYDQQIEELKRKRWVAEGKQQYAAMLGMSRGA